MSENIEKMIKGYEKANIKSIQDLEESLTKIAQSVSKAIDNSNLTQALYMKYYNAVFAVIYKGINYKILISKDFLDDLLRPLHRDDPEVCKTYKGIFGYAYRNVIT
jgi:hypothetical protein